MKERYYSRGLTPLGEKTVCAQCVSDYAISDFVRANANSSGCAYCGCSDCQSVDVDEVALFVLDALESEYEDPANEVAYDSEEGGYVSPTEIYDTRELLERLLGEPDVIEGYLDDLVIALPDGLWVHKNPYGPTKYERFRWDWRRFCEQIKHETRYLFMLEGSDGDDAEWKADPPPFLALEAIGKGTRDLKLVRTLPAGSAVYRARVHASSEAPSAATDLGPPPNGKAIHANRMSPAGIPMFYGAMDTETAVEEVAEDARSKGQAVTTAEFLTVRDLNIVDFTNVPPVPSYFDETARPRRASIEYFHSLVGDLAAPIQKDGREHIEYVPSQVVTEFMRRVFKRSPSEPTHGMLYPSSRRKGGVCCVLFCDTRGVADSQSSAERSEDVMMELVPGSARRVLNAAPPP
jgi:hypothetical protein